ncbi:MAG: glycosyltransferase family 9 protein, partial [Ignavibacteriaceae bacterium]|nr:glycosyltransferase family 9 protein [Ignavibacteriaceae bacterium]
YIRGKKYTRIYSPHRSLRTALIVMQSGVRETYGFDNSSLFHIYKQIIPYKLNNHEVQRNLELIGYNFDESTWRIQPELNISDEIKNKIKNYLSAESIGGKIAAIAPGTVWNTKKYPTEYFSQLVIHLEKKGYTVLLIGNQNDLEICEIISEKSGSSVKVTAGKFSILESVELLKNCEILISNDSAPTHFAMAAGTKTLTIYCSTVPSFGFYPYINKSSFISYDDLDCKPCGIHGYAECPIKTFACGYKLLPADVIKQIDVLLKD